jgi:type IV fimbrial biogenesis protein FimT
MGTHERGMSLIEIMVALSIVGIVMMVVGPSFGNWIQNSQIRNAAESVAMGLQKARLEALKQNRPVAFHVTDAASTAWEVCIYDVVADVCSTTLPKIDSKGPGEGGENARLAVDTTQSNPLTPLTIGSNVPGIAVFDTFGRLLVTPNANLQRIDVRNPKSQDERRMVIFVSTGGQVRMCDPQVAKSVSPQGCV